MKLLTTVPCTICMHGVAGCCQQLSHTEVANVRYNILWVRVPDPPMSVSAAVTPADRPQPGLSLRRALSPFTSTLLSAPPPPIITLPTLRNAGRDLSLFLNFTTIFNNELIFNIQTGHLRHRKFEPFKVNANV